MTATPSPSSITRNGLSSLVGTPCTVTRVGRPYNGHGTLFLGDLEAHWLQPPQLGKPMWFVVGDANDIRTVRTSPVVAIDTGAPEHVVSVRTENARYRFVFGFRLAMPRPL